MTSLVGIVSLNRKSSFVIRKSLPSFHGSKPALSSYWSMRLVLYNINSATFTPSGFGASPFIPIMAESGLTAPGNVLKVIRQYFAVVGLIATVFCGTMLPETLAISLKFIPSSLTFNARLSGPPKNCSIPLWFAPTMVKALKVCGVSNSY